MGREPRFIQQHLSGGSTPLTKTSVANVYDVQKVLKGDLIERAGELSATELERVSSGLRLVLGL